MTEQEIIKEINQRQYFLKLAQHHSRQHDIVLLSRELNQLQFQLTQFIAQ